MPGERAENGGRSASADPDAGERLVHGTSGTSSLTRELLRRHLARNQSELQVPRVEPSRPRIVQGSAFMIGDAVTWIERCEYRHGACVG
jgi:hypothetical protein